MRLASGLIAGLLLFLHSTAISQEPIKGVITGRLTDAEGGAPLPGANVYLSYTTLGTTTAEDGTFRIRNVPTGVFDLVASLLGYEQRVVRARMEGGDSLSFDIVLSARAIQSAPVDVVASEPKEWQENLERFRKAFIGESRNAERCRIMNPEVLEFAFDPSTQLLTASSDSVIRIENRAFGYTLSLTLAKFVWDMDQDVGEYLIYPKFKEIPAENAKEASEWEANRAASYDGSLRHFLRSVEEGKAGAEGFKIYGGKRDKLSGGRGHMIDPGELMVKEDDGVPFRRLSFPNALRVEYRHNFKESMSILGLREKFAIVDPFGNLVNPLALEVVGSWGKNRVADLLPNH